MPLAYRFAPDFSFPVEISKYTGMHAGLAFPRFRDAPKRLKSRRRRKSDATSQRTGDNSPGPPAHFGRIVEILKNAELRRGVSVYDISRNLKVDQSAKSPKIGRDLTENAGQPPGVHRRILVSSSTSRRIPDCVRGYCLRELEIAKVRPRSAPSFGSAK